ncbi:quinone-dependent dihydroorotate dehydrogenase [Corynebacterium anserum]|uniref:Dihydroorotate dehydrogenase (quinone) n=1 Tax=Corynebacterium anserum TaxID=2684406 RepID=A0A7G7YND1_9CORY|nr:quinone-dependent dihydroorotate dehydrogenase [Corynebacterium anserum]MBC2681559.1 quinone-dependent dihydroorotate dehydrogenase [Corynebacterium anserum]QNH96001.1 quinone-dependent dihydroorotate dehydrogenase [Corynebacterium anserum]
MSTVSPSHFRTFRAKAYGLALKAMFRMPPERIHSLMSSLLEAVNNSDVVLRTLRKMWVVNDVVLAQDVAGIHFPRPLGLAAGFDKDAKEVNVWGSLGFGYAEVGTLTILPQPGNPTPRLFRLTDDRAILNRMGFNNEGTVAATRRLEQRRATEPVGVNLGKSKLTDADVAAHDYRRSARVVGDIADYLVINVSSPNTPGLRDLQAVESLRPIVQAVQEENNRPLFVKIAPDLTDEDVLAVTDMALELGVAGIIATNTTISREGLRTDASYVRALGAGGVSGAPVAERSMHVLKIIAQRAEGNLALISVGGIETPEQAWERIAAGAHLIQGYTPFIYGGPDWIRDIHRGIADQIRAHGLSSISEAVGSNLPWTLGGTEKTR